MTASLRAARRRLLAASCLVAFAAAALAAGGGKAAAKPAKQPILTAAQLQACLARKDELHAKTDEALADKAAIATEKAGIEQSAETLKGEVAVLDRSSASAVDAYNAKAAERNRRIQAYQAHVDAYNDKAKAVQALQDDYAKSCENRRYDENDLPAAKAKP